MAYSSSNNRVERRKKRREEGKVRRNERRTKRRKERTRKKGTTTSLKGTMVEPSSLAEKTGRSFADIGFKLRNVGKKINIPGMFARTLAPEKTEKAWDVGREQSEATSGRSIQYFGSEIGSEAVRGFGKGYAEKTYTRAEQEGLVATGYESKWEKLVMSAPTSLGGLAVGAGAGLATGPIGGIAARALYTGGMEAGAKYDEALREGATEEQARVAARITGSVNAFLEIAPGLRQTKYLPKPVKDKAQQLISKSVLRKVMEFSGRRVVDASVEGGTELAQEVVGNLASKYTYDPDKDWKENVAEAGELGAYMGLIMSGFDASIGAMNVGKPMDSKVIPPKITPKEADSKISEIVSSLQKKVEEKPDIEKKRLPEKPKEVVEKEKEGVTSTKQEGGVKQVAKKADEGLAKEARKYKSEEEFIGAITQKNPYSEILNKKTLELKSLLNKEGHDSLLGVPDRIRQKPEFETIKNEIDKILLLEKQYNKLTSTKRREALKNIDIVTQQKIRKGEITEENLKDIYNKSMAEKMGVSTTIDKAPKDTAISKLKQGQRDLLKGAKQLQKETYGFARREITEQFGTKIKDVEQVKKDIVIYAKENLPAYVRGNLLTAVRTAKTQKNLEKAFQRIDKIASDTRKKTISKEIVKTFNRIKDSKSIAVDYRDKIVDIVSTIDLKERKGKTIKKLQALKDHIKQEEAKGKNVLLPKRILKTLKILEKKPYNLLRSEDLEVIHQEILTIEEAGRKKVKNMEGFDKLRKDNWNKYTLENVKKIKDKDKELILPDIKGEISLKDRLKNWKNRVSKEGQRLDLSLLIMDNIFDMMGIKEVKKKYDHNFSNYLDFKWKITEIADGLKEYYEIDNKSSKKIDTYSAGQQNLQNKVMVSSDVTEKQINELKLTENEKAYLKEMQKIYKRIHGTLSKFLRKEYNMNIGYIEDYSYYRNDYDLMDEVEVYKRFNQKEVDDYIKKKEVERGYTKKRTGAEQRINLDYHGNFTEYVDNVAYLMNMGKDIKMFHEIFNSLKFKEKAGAVGTKQMVEYNDLLARKGGVKGAVMIKRLDSLRRNVGAAVLGFKLSSTLIQPTALLEGAAIIDRYAFTGFRDVIASEEWRNFLYKNFPKLRERGFDDPAALEYCANKTIAQMQEEGYQPLKFLDYYTAGGVTAGAYMKYLDEHNIPLDFNKVNPEAMTYAQEVMSQTQASAFFLDLPAAVSRGRITGIYSLDRAIMQFQTFPTYKWNLYRYTMPKLGKQKKYKAMAAGMFFLILGDLAVVGIRQLSRKAIREFAGLFTDQEDEDDDKTFTGDVISEIITTVPFTNQALSVIQYGSSPFPVGDVIGKGGKAIKQTVTGRAASTKARGGIGIAATAGKVSGIPGTVQIADIAKKIIVPAMQPKSSGKPKKKTKIFGKKKNESIIDKVNNLIE